MKTYRGVDVQIHVFLTWTLAVGEWSASRPCRFTPEERNPDAHWIGGWMGPRAGLDCMQKRKFLTLPGLYSCFSIVQKIVFYRSKIVNVYAQFI
jgi:hypothetical protein